MNRRFAMAMAALLIADVVGAAGALKLCDYRSPQTDLTSLWLSANYRYFDSPTTPGVDVNAGRAVVSFNKLYDSPNLGYTLAGVGDLGLVNLGLSDVATQASGTLRYYIAEQEPYFGFAGFEGGYAAGQPLPGLRMSVGAGYGRFSNVTPLAKAFRIQSILLERKAISTALPDDTILAVGKEIGRRIEYADVKDLVATVVRLLEGASGTKLDARTILMVEDEILATGRERYCGWAVQAGLGYEVVDPYDGPRDLVVTAAADAAYAPEPGSQLLLRAAAAGPFDILNQHTLTVTASYERVLDEISSFQGSIALQRVKPVDADAVDSISSTFQISFLVGGANIGISLSFGKVANATEWSKDLSISLALKLL
jgi:hypothetical protein